MQSKYDFFGGDQEQYFETVIQKLVKLEHANTGFVEHIKIHFYYNPIARQINFSRSLNEYFTREYAGMDLCRVFYLDENNKEFTYAGNFPFEKDVFVKYEQLQDEFVSIRLKPISYDDSQEDQPENFDLLNKHIQSKKRVKERTIREVLSNVAKWRQMYECQHISLEAGAKMLGISKKSLEDYYMKIKLAENYGFEFALYQNEGFGILRKFVKQKHQKKKPTIKILSKYLNSNIKKKENEQPKIDIDDYFLRDDPYNNYEEQEQQQQEQQECE